jgi:hypothetical protein
MKFKILILLILIPSMNFAEPIVSLEWSALNNRLIIVTPSEIRLYTEQGTQTLAGPNKNMRDATLYEDDTQLLVATEEGAFVTSVDKPQWQPFNTGLEENNIEFVFTNVELQNVLYAATQEIVYKYTPEDNAWVNMDMGPGGSVTDYLHSNMPDSMDTGWIFASTTTGVAFTADCFCFWRDARNFAHTVSAITFQPENPSWYYAVTEQGLMESQDGARTWSKLAELPVTDGSALVSAGLETMYLGTASGDIWQFNKPTGKWEKILK